MRASASFLVALAVGAGVCEGADPDSTLIFSHAAGPDVTISYDGQNLLVPGYCEQESCDTYTKDIQSLEGDITEHNGKIKTIRYQDCYLRAVHC